MPSISPAADHHRARISGITAAIKTGARKPDDPELAEARRAFIEAKADAWIEKMLDQAPPLSDEQRTRLAELLRPVRQPVSDRKSAVDAALAQLDGGDTDAA